MSKSLEALEHLVDGNLNEVNYYRRFANGSIEIMKDKETIEKELKSLEIIKNKKVNVDRMIFCDSCFQYNYGIAKEERHLSEEEFKLLKEWLKNE